ncbi:hypothetical protein GCM10010466_11580 [Planomonospora alba]|uniref:Uncharacterized protein n=1 Tax=Planomonospora alba TaxID=161354 RepID=A0ABP6MS53_9ACTN
MIEAIAVLAVVLSVPVALACGAVPFARHSAPRSRYGLVRGRHLVTGATLAVTGIAVLAFIAWYTHEDQHYDDFGSAMLVLLGMLCGALLVFGLGPFVPWTLGVLGRNAARLPPAFRPAARHLAGGSAWTSPAVALTMTATAAAVAVTTVMFAETAQGRAHYQPRAWPGALIVEGFSAEQAAAVRAALRHELPDVPVAQDSGGAGSPSVESSEGLVWTNPCIGDRALLHYLTGDPSVPYDEGTAVVVSADEEETGSVLLRYHLPGDSPPVEKTIPAITVRPADPRMEAVFVPAKVVQDSGRRLEPERLITDPSLHRTTADEQERLDRRLGETATTYVERGFQAPTDWWYVVAGLLLIALTGALAATRAAGSERVLLRVSGRSAAPSRTLRFLVACRAAAGTACGTVLGAVAGCVIGLLLAWPLTAPIDWDPPPRVPFDTPWELIAALVVGLPVLAAAIAALTSPGQVVRKARKTARITPG